MMNICINILNQHPMMNICINKSINILNQHPMMNICINKSINILNQHIIWWTFVSTNQSTFWINSFTLSVLTFLWWSYIDVILDAMLFGLYNGLVGYWCQMDDLSKTRSWCFKIEHWMNTVNHFGSSILLEMNFLFQVLDRQEDQIITEVWVHILYFCFHCDCLINVYSCILWFHYGFYIFHVSPKLNVKIPLSWVLIILMWLVLIIYYCPNLFSVLLRTFLKVALIVTSII